MQINIKELRLIKEKTKKKSQRDIHHQNQDQTKKERKIKKRKRIKREIGIHLPTKVWKNKEKLKDKSMIRDQDKKKFSEKLYKDKYFKARLLE